MSDPIDFLRDRFKAAPDKTAFIEPNGSATYGELLARIDDCRDALIDAGIGKGASVQLRGDFGLEPVAWMLALLSVGAIVSPLAPVSLPKAEEFLELADAAWSIDGFSGQITTHKGGSHHALFDELVANNDAGLIIFSSGTTGTSKGAVHAASRLLSKFEKPGKDFSTLAFLLFDHIAGVDTLFYCLANTSRIICPAERTAQSVCQSIEAHSVEVLPTAPSFLNLMLLSGANQTYDVSSLKIVTYGAEMMPQSLLERVSAALPNTKLVQKYGTSEIGALRSQTENSTSRWLNIGEEGKDWRIVDDQLEIKTKTAMLGYLNAPSPFTNDGYYKTGDQVERNGKMIRFLGRESDVINVGGAKVFPAEVEAALRALPDVIDAAVFGSPHPILGACVCARIQVAEDGPDARDMRVAVRKGLSGVVEPYKIPQKILMTHEPLVTERFKQKRG